MADNNVVLSQDQFDKLMQGFADIKAAAQSSAAGNPTDDKGAQEDLAEYNRVMRGKYETDRTLERNGVEVEITGFEDEKNPKGKQQIKRTLRQQRQEWFGDKVLARADKEFQELSDDFHLLKSYHDAHSKGANGGVNPAFNIRESETYQELQRFYKTLPEEIKRGLGRAGLVKRAMDTQTNAEGLEFVPTGFSSQIHELYRLERKVAGLFQEFNMPTATFNWPLEAADAVAYLAAESTSDTASKYTASTPGSDQLAFVTKLLAARVLFSAELEEDSIIAVAPYVYKKLAIAHTDAIENAVLNGDTSGTHQDSDTTNAADVRKAWPGLRKLALAPASNACSMDLSTFTTANLRTLRQKAGKYGLKLNSEAWIASIASYYKMLGLAEVLTMDKYGQMATVIQGELAKFDGIPVIVSEFQRQDLNATGVYDGTTTTKTALSLVNRDEFMFGRRRGATIVTDRSLYLESGQVVTVATQRIVFKAMRTNGATNPIAVVGYNI